MNKKVITIFGSGKSIEEDDEYRASFELGRKLASSGFTIANGGYGGTMEAVAKGAREAGGDAIGVTCRAFGPGGANEYVTREIKTDTLDERLLRLIELGDGYVVLAGSTGTLLELAQVWEFKNKGFLKADKPVILLGKFWEPVVALVTGKDCESRQYLKMIDSPEEVVNYLMSALRI